jgi:hypothetical protein
VPARLRELGWAVEAHDDHFAPATKDTELFGALASKGWVFLTQDAKIRYRPAETKAFRDAGLAVFVVVSGNLTWEQTVEVLVRARKRMEKKAASLKRPFVCRVAKDGSLKVLDR